MDKLELYSEETELSPEDISEDASYEKTQELTVEAKDAGARLDSYISTHGDVSRSQAAKLIDDGMVTIPDLNSAISKNTRLRANDRIIIKYPLPQDADITAEDISLDIIFEDSDILVVNKPKGMVVHPAPGNYSGTLCNALLYHCRDSLSGIGGVKRPGIVHRIDKDTSGLLVVAKNDAAHISLAQQLKTHAVSRVYHAICIGNIRDDSGTVNKPIGRNPRDRKKMAVFPNGAEATDTGVRDAVTHYSVLERFSASSSSGQSFTHIKCELETGRTHQIRVHLASLGHPLLGDVTYGGDGTRFEKLHRSLINGQCLHAKELRLTHPRTGERMTFTSPMPEYLDKLLAILSSGQ